LGISKAVPKDRDVAIVREVVFVQAVPA